MSDKIEFFATESELRAAIPLSLPESEQQRIHASQLRDAGYDPNDYSGSLAERIAQAEADRESAFDGDNDD